MEREYTVDDFDMVKVDPATCHRCFFWTHPLGCGENPLVIALRDKFQPGAGCWFWGEESKFEKYTMPMANWKLKKERQLKLFQ